MKIASISDLHLATDEFADSFQHNEDQFLHFLDYLEDNYDQIVLNGDIYDPCKSYKLDQHRDQIFKIMEKYSRLETRFKQDKYIQLIGNHDYVLDSLGYKSSHIYNAKDGSQYFFAHGHQFDHFRGKGNLFVIFTALVDWLDKFVWTNAEAYLSWFEEKFFSWINLGSESLLLDKAKEYLLQQKSKQNIIVMGHSHHATHVEFNNNIYLNSGACVRKRIEYVHIDTDEKEHLTQSWSIKNKYGIATETHYDFSLNHKISIN